MKAVLVIDIPKRCGECICYQCGFCLTNFGVVKMDDKPADWCPLRPLPKRLLHEYEQVDDEYGYVEGWNACLDAITGETE